MKMCQRLYLVVDNDIHYERLIHLSIQKQKCKYLLINTSLWSECVAEAMRESKSGKSRTKID